MYIIGTELEPDDTCLYHDVYDILAINTHLKPLLNSMLFIATRNFEKIYRCAIIKKTSKPKEQLFENQIEYINKDANMFLYTKNHKTTYLIKSPSHWSFASTISFKQEFISCFKHSNTLYQIQGEFENYLTCYLMNNFHFDWCDIQIHCDIFKQPILVHPYKYKTFIANIPFDVKMQEHMFYGVNSKQCSEDITCGSTIFFQQGDALISYIKIKRVKYVHRINYHRFVNAFMVIPIHSQWDIELEVEVACKISLDWKQCEKNSFQIQSICCSQLDEFLFTNSPRTIMSPMISIDSSYNFFTESIPKIENLQTIYILSTTNNTKFYEKLTMNDEEIIYLDLNPFYFFKVYTEKWCPRILKQFLNDIKHDRAYLLLTTKKYEKFFLSMKVTQLNKYKSEKDKISSTCPYGMPLHTKYDADLYGIKAILPYMIKEKSLWKVNGEEFGQSVKHYNAISHQLTELPEKELHAITSSNLPNLFHYFKQYLKYETKAREQEQFTNHSREVIETYSDVIHPSDYGLKIKTYWTL